MNDPLWTAFIVGGMALFVALGVWGVAKHCARRKALLQSLTNLGFRPCPDEQGELEQIVARFEHARGSKITLKDAMRRRGEPPVYYYLKARASNDGDTVVLEDEVLFPVLRGSGHGVALTLKPSSLAPGLSTRMLIAVATSSAAAKLEGLARIELPARLHSGNVIAALGPEGSRLDDLVPAGVLSVVKDLGDVGVLQVRFRDTWCAVSSISSRAPLRVDELLTRLRPLLQAIEPLARACPAASRSTKGASTLA